MTRREAGLRPRRGPGAARLRHCPPLEFAARCKPRLASPRRRLRACGFSRQVRGEIADASSASEFDALSRVPQKDTLNYKAPGNTGHCCINAFEQRPTTTPTEFISCRETVHVQLGMRST